MAIEIVAPESIEQDYKKKRRLYQRFKVPEYWIVDEVRHKVLMLRLGPDGKYHRVRPKQGKYHSEVLPGFWFRADWFWQRPLPKTAKVIDEIMGRAQRGGPETNGAH